MKLLFRVFSVALGLSVVAMNPSGSGAAVLPDFGPNVLLFEPGMTNIVLQDRCPLDFTEHFEIAADRNASVLVLNALDPAHPRPLVCVPVLPFVGGA